MAKVNRNIDLIILSILNVNDCYGYEIVKLAKEISGGSIIIKEGALYPIFYRLLKMNYISSYNETIQNRFQSFINRCVCRFYGICVYIKYGDFPEYGKLGDTFLRFEIDKTCVLSALCNYKRQGLL